MRDYLVFQLYGPFASWGDIAVGETRPSTPYPTRSAILGLLAAALGLKRPDTATDDEERAMWEEAHGQLGRGYGVGIRVYHPGIPLSDYHTAQVPSSGKGRNRLVFATRRDELTRVARHGLNTILSRREYRQDAFYGVALWARPGAPRPLGALQESLRAPVFPLYLGRKSCPPALPLDPRVVEATSLEAALDSTSPHSVLGRLEQGWKSGPPQTWLRDLQEAPPVLTWDTDGEARRPADESYLRRDEPVSRRRWQFAVRMEHRAYGDEHP